MESRKKGEWQIAGPVDGDLAEFRDALLRREVRYYQFYIGWYNDETHLQLERGLDAEGKPLDRYIGYDIAGISEYELGEFVDAYGTDRFTETYRENAIEWDVQENILYESHAGVLYPEDFRWADGG